LIFVPIANADICQRHLPDAFNNFGNEWEFELCRRTQQPSLTSRLVGGSTFGLWPLFHLRDGGNWTEMTATQYLLLFLSFLLSIAIYRLQVTTFLALA
jgi:hypothetical protein